MNEFYCKEDPELTYFQRQIFTKYFEINKIQEINIYELLLILLPFLDSKHNKTQSLKDIVKYFSQKKYLKSKRQILTFLYSFIIIFFTKTIGMTMENNPYLKSKYETLLFEIKLNLAFTFNEKNVKNEIDNLLFYEKDDTIEDYYLTNNRGTILSSEQNLVKVNMTAEIHSNKYEILESQKKEVLDDKESDYNEDNDDIEDINDDDYNNNNRTRRIKNIEKNQANNSLKLFKAKTIKFNSQKDLAIDKLNCVRKSQTKKSMKTLKNESDKFLNNNMRKSSKFNYLINSQNNSSTKIDFVDVAINNNKENQNSKPDIKDKNADINDSMQSFNSGEDIKKKHKSTSSKKISPNSTDDLDTKDFSFNNELEINPNESTLTNNTNKIEEIRKTVRERLEQSKIERLNQNIKQNKIYEFVVIDVFDLRSYFLDKYKKYNWNADLFLDDDK